MALVGTGFMGGLHARAYTVLPLVFPALPVRPVLDLVIDVDGSMAEAARRQYGFGRWSSDWRAALDEGVDIVDICAPNDVHAEIAIAALSCGKHVVCEKPLARTLREAEAMAAAAEGAPQAVTLVGFNNRFAPATLFARQLIDAGALGPIRHYRARFLSNFAGDPAAPLSWRFEKERAGSGALSDVGSHLIDMARYLVGEVCDVHGGILATVIPERPLVRGGTFAQPGVASGLMGTVDVDDQFAALLRFDNGATGVIEGSRVATGHGAEMTFEINGSHGAIRLNSEHVNELEVWRSGPASSEQGWTLISTGPDHPFYQHFSPIAGQGIGYADTIVIELATLLRSIAEGLQASPSFHDGVAVHRVMDLIERSAAARTGASQREGAQQAGSGGAEGSQ